MPTGMKPIGLASPGRATLKTARLLLSALATKRICPSGVRLRLFGVLPAGAVEYSAQLIVSSPLPFAVSITLTRVELAQATNRVFLSGGGGVLLGGVLWRPV